ncbi:MAG TPA: TonB-dependent receptor, partial [Thermoanaerobaculia bacterium]|nr:TonB-dependent receptor [Thermoanaerobaculia bacterium]
LETSAPWPPSAALPIVSREECMHLRGLSRAVVLLAFISIVMSFPASAGAQPPPPETPAASPEPVPPPEPEPSPGPPPTPPDPGTPPPAGSSKVFNPDIAVIGDFLGAIGKNDSQFATPSLEMHESELSLQAIVDPYARADFFLVFAPDEVGVEEGFLTFTSLPANFLLKVGKMRASFGKVNQMHNHTMPWTDRPLVTQDLVGGEEGISDAGVSLSRLIVNPILFLEATAEVYRGESPELFSAPQREDLTYVGRLRGYRDVTESTNLDVGGSFARGTAKEGAGLHTSLIGADLTLRWRPLRRAIYRRLLARTELVWSRRDLVTAEQARAFGLYGSVEYQLGRRWFAGLRYDRSERADQPSLVDKGGSALLTYQPSEFSLLRAQYRHTSYGEGIKANELLFQLLFSIGAHGAHPF